MKKFVFIVLLMWHMGILNMVSNNLQVSARHIKHQYHNPCPAQFSL